MARSKSKAVGQTDPQVQLFMAEDFREEIGGKVSAIGLYTDRTLVLQLPGNVPDPTREAPIAIRSLGFLINVSNLGYAAQISVEIDSGQGMLPLVAPIVQGPIDPKRTSNIIAVMSPCLIGSFGIKTLKVKIDKFEFDFPYEIRRESPPLSTLPLQLPNETPEKTPVKKSGRRK